MTKIEHAGDLAVKATTICCTKTLKEAKRFLIDASCYDTFLMECFIVPLRSRSKKDFLNNIMLLSSSLRTQQLENDEMNKIHKKSLHELFR